MKRAPITFIAIVVLLISAWDFARFIERTSNWPEPTAYMGEAGIVLTGGPSRIEHGIKALSDGDIKQLLISGVHPDTSDSDILSVYALEPDLLDCCVTIGRKATTTKENADEVAKWLKAKGYNKALVYTAQTHLPRALIELQRASPGVEFLGTPIGEDIRGPWYSSFSNLRRGVTEWIKYRVVTLGL